MSLVLLTFLLNCGCGCCCGGSGIVPIGLDFVSLGAVVFEEDDDDEDEEEEQDSCKRLEFTFVLGGLEALFLLAVTVV